MIEGCTGCRLRSELNRIIECGKLPWMDHYPEYLYNNFLDELSESENNSGQFYASVYLFQRIFPSPICLKNLWSCSYTCCWYMWANTPVSNYLKMLRNRIGIFPSVPCYFDRPARTKIFSNYQSFLSQYKSKIDSVLSRYSLEDFERQGEQYFLEHKVASEPEQRKQNEESLYW